MTVMGSPGVGPASAGTAPMPNVSTATTIPTTSRFTPPLCARPAPKASGMCTASPVALRARDDCLAAVPGTHDLGIVRDPSRCAQKRSAHCCGTQAENPAARGMAVVLAWDCGHAIGDRTTAGIVRDVFLADPRVDYVISFGVLYKPDGTTQPNTGHADHVHITFDPSAANDTRPFIFTEEDIDIMDADTKAYFDAKFVKLQAEHDTTQKALAKVVDETKGLKERTGLIRRIARAVAHHVGVTQPDIDSQA
jgi:hypothetical protein